MICCCIFRGKPRNSCWPGQIAQKLAETSQGNSLLTYIYPHRMCMVFFCRPDHPLKTDKIMVSAVSLHRHFSVLILTNFKGWIQSYRDFIVIYKRYCDKAWVRIVAKHGIALNSKAWSISLNASGHKREKIYIAFFWVYFKRDVLKWVMTCWCGRGTLEGMCLENVYVV